MKNTLIYFDKDSPAISTDFLYIVDKIFPDNKKCNYAVSLEDLSEELNGIFDKSIHIDDKRIFNYDIVNITNALEELHQNHSFDCILIPATQFGRMLAPRLAMRLGVGLVADVTGIDFSKGQVELVRPAFDGKMLAGIVCSNKKPLMASIRANVFDYQSSKNKKTENITFYPSNFEEPKITLLEAIEKPFIADIRDSEVLISSGGGVGENWKKTIPLAKSLGGMASISRRIVDAGLAPREIQVGQSGKIVSPKLYVALGIYGSLQHVAGLKDVDYIISVNTNKNAPICSLSDIVVEGDAIEFADKLLKRISQGDKQKEEVIASGDY